MLRDYQKALTLEFPFTFISFQKFDCHCIIKIFRALIKKQQILNQYIFMLQRIKPLEFTQIYMELAFEVTSVDSLCIRHYRKYWIEVH